MLGNAFMQTDYVGLIGWKSEYPRGVAGSQRIRTHLSTTHRTRNDPHGTQPTGVGHLQVWLLASARLGLRMLIAPHHDKMNADRGREIDLSLYLY